MLYGGTIATMFNPINGKPLLEASRFLQQHIGDDDVAGHHILSLSLQATPPRRGVLLGGRGVFLF